MPHISVLTFFGCVFLAFVLGMSAGAWVYQRVFTWKYQKLVKKSQGAWDNWTEDDIRDDLAVVLGTANRAVDGFWQRADAEIRKDAIGHYAAMTGQHPPGNLACQICNRPFAVHMKGQPCPGTVGDLGVIRGPIRKENHGSTEKSNDKEEV
jgi:hypothetical protein